MKGTRFFLLAAVLCGAWFAPSASAQANISIVSGSGQVICSNCGPLQDFYFAPLTVKVTDSAGKPMSGVTVYWSFPNSDGYFNNSYGQTYIALTTDTNGVSSVIPYVAAPTTSNFVYYSQAVVTANVVNLSPLYFYLTNTGQTQYQFPQVSIDYSNVPSGTVLSGTSGSSAPSFTVRTWTQSGVVPNIAVRLINSDGTSGPSSTVVSAYCATGPGADPYSVLTDSTGTATCTPIFGPVAGSGDVYALIGTVPPSVSTVYTTSSGVAINPFGNTGNIHLSVAAVSVGSVVTVSSASQILTAGSTATLVARVTDTSGNSLQAQTVNWTVYPVNAATFANTSQITGADGLASNAVTLNSSASGTITIKATSKSNANAVATFTITAQQPITLTGITKTSGDNQTAVVGTGFSNPLTVTVNSTTGAASNVSVQFAVSGAAATLSVSSAITNSAGQASVYVTAGSTPGVVTVTASAGGFSQSFTFTIIPQGPTNLSFVNGADQQLGSISPCSLASLYGSGVAPVGTQPMLVGQNSLAGTSLTVNGTTAPILWAGTVGTQQQVLFQVPCEASAGNATVAINVNGGTATATVLLKPASPGIFQTLMSDGVQRAVIIRPDGSIASLTNPVRRGEYATAVVTGLGPVSPSVGTNGFPIPGTPSTVNGQVIVGVNNAGALVSSAVATTSRPGVYQVTFQVPTNAPQSNNVVFSIGIVPVGSSTAYYTVGTTIPIQ